MNDAFGVRSTLEVNGRHYELFSLDKLGQRFNLTRLPFSLKILLENLLRNENDVDVEASDIEALASWQPRAGERTEIAFNPSRVVLQDFTGVPAVVDLATMRDAMADLGGKPGKINPLSPAELVIDHSVQVDAYGRPDSLNLNSRIEYERNRERYAFLRWGQGALDNFKVVPPSTGIVHQVNLEYLARVVFDAHASDGSRMAYPDTLVGTDSHTTMINGLGVLGWGVGGIEAEAVMLGQPISMLIPDVVGFKLTGKLPEGSTATDLVLTVTQMLREQGVVGKFVEFFGDGLSDLPLADRATISNMSPEYGATCGIFPIDEESLRYMRLTGRDEEQVALTEAYAKAQGLFRHDGDPDPEYTEVLELDMSTVRPSLAGPKRPQDRVVLDSVKQDFQRHLAPMIEHRCPQDNGEARYESEGGGTAVGNDDVESPGCRWVEMDGQSFQLSDGAVVIAAITSCTNTSNPAVMVGAGQLARNAAEKGLEVKPWVKTSLAPGSKVVTDYLTKAGLLDDLESLGFHLVGYGCTTCIGNSGPLRPEISQAIAEGDLVTTAVLSGNRNFEGRIHAEVKMNYLASPPLVVAYALAGRMDIDLTGEPLGEDKDGKPVYLADIWPSSKEIHETIAETVDPEMFRHSYESVFAGDERWNSMDVPQGERYAWDAESTYIKKPPFFEGMSLNVDEVPDVHGARCLVLVGDSITTDHISPAGAIKADSPAGQYLQERGVSPKDFNSYGSRRGNHEVMMRGTFANVRLRNQLVPGTEGGWTKHIPSGEEMPIFDAAMRYQQEDTPLVVLAGKEYGTGSSRDWAAKGTRLLGVKAVIAESFERIHRSNLIGMGVLPLQFKEGESWQELGLTGHERFDISGLNNAEADAVTVTATPDDGKPITFQARVRIDTPKEADYYRHGGILHYVLRALAQEPDPSHSEVA